MALPESCGLVWIFLGGGLIMALAILILSCLGAAASEGAKALLSTVFALSASPAKPKPKPKPNSRGSKTGGVERAAHAGATTTTAAAAASKRASGKTKQASGRPSNKNISGSGNGSARVPPAREARNGKGGGGGAASAAVPGSCGGVHSAEPALNEKAVVSQLLDQFESLASMMGQKGGGGGGNHGQKDAALEADNLTTEELWQLATEATRKRFEHLGREIQCSLFKLDQHLVDGKRRACREGCPGGGQGSTRDSGPVALTKKQLKDIEVDTRALHDLNRSLKDMLRWWGVSPNDERGLQKLSPLLRKTKSNYAATAAAAAAAATAPPDPTNSAKASCFLSPSRANPSARGANASANSAGSSNANAKPDDAQGAPRIAGSGAHGARKPKRRPSPAGTVTNLQGPAKVSRRTSSISASTSAPTPAAAAAPACDADASRASPMAPLVGIANPGSPSSVPGAGASVPGDHVVDVRPPAGTGAAAPAAAPGPSVGAESSPSRAPSASTAPGGIPSRRTHQTKTRPIGEAAAAAPARGCGSASTGPPWGVHDGSSIRGSTIINFPTTQPFPVAATYPSPLPPATERRASAASESFASVSTPGSEGFGCFPPPLLPRPADGGGGCERVRGGVLQEARACAPAQHLAVLRALLGGDEEEQRAAVAWSDSDSDGERDRNGEGQTGGVSGGPRQDGGGRGGRAKGKTRGGTVAGRCVRA